LLANIALHFPKKDEEEEGKEKFSRIIFFLYFIFVNKRKLCLLLIAILMH
jgi:hypothetical protein